MSLLTKVIISIEPLASSCFLALKLHEKTTRTIFGIVAAQIFDFGLSSSKCDPEGRHFIFASQKGLKRDDCLPNYVQ